MEAEYKAWWSLALACANESAEALQAAKEAESDDRTCRGDGSRALDTSNGRVDPREANDTISRQPRLRRIAGDRKRRRIRGGVPRSPKHLCGSRAEEACERDAPSHRCSAPWTHDSAERSVCRFAAPTSNQPVRLPLTTRARDPRSRRPGSDKPRDGKSAVHHRDHGEGASAAHLREAWRTVEDGGRRSERSRTTL